jgi:phosphate transport system substrate-binding protein
VITGSSTVQPISSAVAEQFSEANPDVAPSVDGPGTGDGFKTFCAGEADITGASRKIKDEEATSCADGGVKFVELKVGIDGLTVATNPKNTAVECLDNAALYALMGPESEGFGNWSDANALATELGSKYTTLPDAALDVFGPGEESGTYDTFVEFAIAKTAESREQEKVTRPDYNASANDNVIVEGIEGSDTSLGWVGYAYFKEQGDKMRSIAIADKEGNCVAPTDDTVADGSYPFSRGLYIYVNVDKAKANPAVAGYVDYYLSDEGIASVSEVGYVAEPAAELTAARDSWTAAKA